MRSIQYRRAQRARIKRRRLNQYIARMSGFSYMYPIEEFEQSKNFKIAIDTPKSCSCGACTSHKNWYAKNSVKCLRKQEQSYLKVNSIDSQLKDWQHYALGE